MIDRETIVKRIDEKLLVSLVGEEAMMMNVESGDYIGLNEVGTVIWNHMAEPIAVKNICDKLCIEFDINLKDCEINTIKYLKILHSEEMIEVK